ncbi:MAG: aspartate carbamoyltransferase catalytic subunit [SAR202 cluster bacterium]|nr:aspartate carbamoyltransferase catalytic subunit [SAR202 cluster bacterium]
MARVAERSRQQSALWSGARRHVLDLDDFTRAEIEDVLLNADGMKEVFGREVKKTPALRGKTIITVFFEASTRTRVSFEQAGKILGADVINVTSSASSVTKGESLLNTVRTLQAMQIDALVMRHPHSGSPYFVARHLDASVINAGDGTHAHPTQALLDIYTVERLRGKLDGKRVAIIGDILYSRVARSNMIGMQKMGAEVVVCGPPTLLPAGFVPGSSVAEGLPYEGVRIARRVEEAVDGADVVMVLRIQRERQDAGHLPSLREYSREYGINAERLKLARPDALLMHPGPMNEGVEISTEVAHGPQSVIEEQVANGVAIRMAILYMLCARAANVGA